MLGSVPIEYRLFAGAGGDVGDVGDEGACSADCSGDCDGVDGVDAVLMSSMVPDLRTPSKPGWPHR
ncbi:MAG: hypothetical protein ACKOVB_15970 [Terrabacter sp.]